MTRRIHYLPTPDSVIHTFVYELCPTLSEVFSDPEVQMGFANFLRAAARIEAHHLNITTSVDSRRE